MDDAPSEETAPKATAPPEAAAPSEETSALTRAGGLLAEGRLVEAGDLLHEAAADALALGQDAAAVRLLQLAAATARSAGSPEMARARAEHAVEVARRAHSEDPSLAVLALAEAAECALALDNPGTAADEFGEAATVPGLPDVVRAALLRRRAGALADAGSAAEAVAVLSGLVTSGQPAGEELAHIRLEMAGVAQRAMLPGRAEYLQHAVEALAGVPNPELHADLSLMRASAAAEDGRYDSALHHAREARRHAALAGSALAYISATMSLVQVIEEAGVGQRARAAVYATLQGSSEELAAFADPELARTAFAPALERRRQQWGEDAYAAAAAAWERREGG